jgi:hypothetical protein
MNTSENQSIETPAADFTSTWRYKVGLTMIIVGNLVILCALLVPLLGVGAGTVGVMVLGGELVSMASIAFLGMEGFKAIKAKFTRFIKAGFVSPVGRIRYYIGVLLFCTHVVTTYTIVIYAWIAFEATTPETPLPIIWGLTFGEQGEMLYWLFLIGELTFLSSIYVLGAAWWEKFRNLFVWEAPSR